MTSLKLFVSHSSRLDDVEHKYTREDRNWRLLDDTCHAIRRKYGDRIEVLVDKDGLLPGDDWSHRLNLWLAECHVAIILFSKRARELFQYIRPLWVEPADAGSLRCAQGRKMPLALNGRLIGWSDDELKTRCYTLERFIERAWPGTGSDKFLPVPLPEARSLSEVQQEIRRRFFGAGDLPPGPNPDGFLDRAVNRDVRTIVLVILAAADKGGLPDPAFLSDLARLFAIYHKLMLAFDIGADRPVLPSSVKDAQPRLEDPDALLAFLTCEYDAFCDERATKTYLDQKYGIGP